MTRVVGAGAGRGRIALALAALSVASCRLGYDADSALSGASTGSVDVAGSGGSDAGATTEDMSPGGAADTGGAPVGGTAATGGSLATAGVSGSGGATTGGVAMGGAGAGGAASGGAGSGGDGSSGTDAGGASGTGGGGSGGTGGGSSGTSGGGSGGSGSGEPTGIVESGESLTTAYGGDGGTVYSDRCPAGQVLVGFVGYADPKPGEQWIDRIQAVCGTLSLSGTGPYSVNVGAGLTLPMRGLSGVKKFTLSCPANTMAIGFEGRSGLYFDQVTLYCAPLQVTGSTGNYVLAIGSFTLAGPAGGSGGSAFARTDCPAGWIANGIEGRDGSYIDKLGLACTEPLLTY